MRTTTTTTSDARCLGGWHKDTSLSSLPDAMTICLYIPNKIARKNNEFAFYLLLGSTQKLSIEHFSGTRHRRAHDPSVVEKIRTTYFTPYDRSDLEKSVTLPTPA